MSKANRLTPKDPRPYGARSMWGWPRRDALKSEPMGAANKHAFPDLSPRSLCGRWKEGAPDVQAQIEVKGACPKCLELHKRFLAGTWSPPSRRKL